MTYTLWSNGRLLGESPLDFVRCMPKLRVGFLHPTPIGEKVLPLAGSVCAATIAYGRAAARCATEQERRRIPEYADWLAAIDASQSFSLELRGPDGSVIPTHDVCVRDFGFLDELDDDDFEAMFEDDAGVDLRDEFADEETMASLGLDDWDAPWDPEADDEDRRWDFDALAADEPWRPAERDCDRRWSRYQLQVELIDESSIP